MRCPVGLDHPDCAGAAATWRVVQEEVEDGLLLQHVVRKQWHCAVLAEQGYGDDAQKQSTKGDKVYSLEFHSASFARFCTWPCTHCVSET